MEQIKKRNIDENCTKNVQSIVESEEIEGYSSCSTVKQRCMTDCAWPLNVFSKNYNITNSWTNSISFICILFGCGMYIYI